jgi:hypothetical protein
MEVKQIEAGEKSPAKRIKFKIEFALVLLGVGRIDEAAKMFEQVLEALDKME